MFKSKKSKGLVGLDIGSSSIKAVELRRTNDGYELVNLGIDSIGQDSIVDGAIMDAPGISSAIQKLFEDNKIATSRVAASVSGHAVFVKKIAVNASNEQELESAILIEAQQNIRFDLADVSLSYHVLGPAGAGEATEVLLLGVKREKLQSHTEAIEQAGKTLRVLDIDAFAVQNAFEASYEPAGDLTAALLNIGASSMNINITRGGLPLFTRDVSVGGNQYTDILQKEFGLSFEEAEKLKMGKEVGHVPAQAELPHLRSVSELLLLEIQKTFDFFRQTTSPDPISRIYLSGGTSRIKGLAELLQAEFNVPVEVLNPFNKIQFSASKFDSDYIGEVAPRMTVAVGLALRSFDPA